jgi:phosphoenolpyruvate carboxykinase (GTP)
VLAWIVQRTAGRAEATATPIGNVPAPGALDGDGLGVPEQDMAELLRVDADEWRREVPLIGEFYARFGERLPVELGEQLDALEHRLS